MLTCSVNAWPTRTCRGAWVIRSEASFAAEATSPNSVLTQRSPFWKPSCAGSLLVSQLFVRMPRFEPGAVVAAAVVGAAVAPPPPPFWFSVQAERPSALRFGFAALRPIAVSIRLIVENRLSFSGPRIAFWMKFAPP